MKKIKWWVWLIIAVLVLGVIGAAFYLGISKSNTNNKATLTMHDHTKEAADATVQESKIGVPITVNNVTVTLESVTYDKEGSLLIKPSDDMEFVNLQISVANGGESEITVLPLHFKIRTSAGDILDYDLGARLSEEGEALSSMYLAGGAKMSGIISFEVPINASKMYLRYYSNAFDDDPQFEIVFKE